MVRLIINAVLLLIYKSKCKVSGNTSIYCESKHCLNRNLLAYAVIIQSFASNGYDLY